MRTLGSYVGGTFVEGRELRNRENPSNVSEVVATASLADAATMGEAVAAARAAARDWRRTPAPRRGEVLRRAADLLEQRQAELGADMSREQGKTLLEARGEVGRSVAILRYFAGQTLAADGASYASHNPGTRLYSRRTPVGVVAAITPWNFPLAIPTWKLAPALAYGNTVVWKPSEVVPLTSTGLLASLIDAGLPAGVVNMVLGTGAAVGSAILNGQVDAVSFTGSTPVGRETILPSAAAAGTAVQLELGGKNVAIVLADADLDLAVTQVANGAFLSAGQKCTATSLVLVDESIRAAFVERLTARAASMTVGNPLEPGVEIGPLATAAQVERFESYLGVEAHGGRLETGGRGPQVGYFARPTVIAGADVDSPAAREEIFGPVAVTSPVRGLAEAIELANRSPFGLTASLFTTNLSSAYQFADEIETGVAKVNQESAGLEFHVPFGGIKDSSYGPAEQGLAAQEFYTRSKTVYLTHAP